MDTLYKALKALFNDIILTLHVAMVLCVLPFLMIFEFCICKTWKEFKKDMVEHLKDEFK